MQYRHHSLRSFLFLAILKRQVFFQNVSMLGAIYNGEGAELEGENKRGGAG
jgi:hypothetical protein